MIDPHSATWLAVKAEIDKELETARTRLETRGLPVADTEHQRGRIAALKDIAALAEPHPEA